MFLNNVNASYENTHSNKKSHYTDEQDINNSVDSVYVGMDIVLQLTYIKFFAINTTFSSLYMTNKQFIIVCVLDDGVHLVANL